MPKTLHMAGMEASAHFLIEAGYNTLACGFFTRSKTKARGIAANFGKRNGKFAWYSFDTESEYGWAAIFTPVNMGRDRFVYTLCINRSIGNNLLVTTSDRVDCDWYEYLMTNYKLPLKKEWIPVLRKKLLDECIVRQLNVRLERNDDNPIMISLGNVTTEIGELLCYDFSELTETGFEEIVTSCLSAKQISVTDSYIPPLEFEGLDEYFLKYGKGVVDNLDKKLDPLVELRPNVRNLALKEKSLFPQQAASVEGALALFSHKKRYAIFNHGMGCGKTIEAASVMEAHMVGKWLQKNPDKTLRDAYAREGIIRYRAIIMAPGHLVAKWASEIEAEIPYAKSVIVNDLSQLVELKERGIVPAGKEFYVIGKDFCKLDTQSSPIPLQVKKRYFSLDICKECKEESQMIVYKKGVGSNAVCPDCQGTSFTPYPLTYKGLYRGLICPECGELLIKNKRYDPNNEGFEDNISSSVLTPSSFAKAKNENATCYHCGAALWGSNAKPLISKGVKPKKPKWYKVTHYTNHTHKGRTSAFVLRGQEKDYYDTCVTIEGLSVSAQEYGPRKVAPARYIKKHMKGYFDFCVLDEVHKYLGESAQSVAAHALIKVSKYTLALTGTISNGTASSFYNLYWMLAPQKMRSLGFHYSSAELMRFGKEYGCVETVYEASDSDSQRGRNSNSRGKQISSPRIKPGISPVLFGRLLMDDCLFLDISDLSKYLPKLKEKVILIEPDDKPFRTYGHVIDTLKEESRGTSGMSALSEMLQFGLSYLDKPYGRADIKNPYVKDCLLCGVRNHDEYASPNVLLNKEKALIKLVNQEMAEGRCVFVYATFTGKEESNVSYRLKELLELHCNLKDRVEIIQSTTPAASKREEYFHKRASEGIKVFITNPQNVETGLDFCFKHNGKIYNYPTLIFYQISYSLATIWQASRRAYRLNQREECRVFYLAYENTLQAAAIEIMAKKQVACAAIQGHFSAEGLSAMAQGVDSRTQLAAALSKNDMSSRETLDNMFDALAVMNEDVVEDEAYAAFKPSLTFYELIGKEKVGEDELFAADVSFADSMEVIDDNFFASEVSLSISDEFEAFFAGFGFAVADKPVLETKNVTTTKKKKVAKKLSIGKQLSLLDFA